jgi:hypothetical protein
MIKPQVNRRARGQKSNGNELKDLVKISPLNGDSNLVMVIEPEIEGINLPNWIRQNGDKMNELVHKHGVVLFRGFDTKKDEDGIAISASLPWQKEETNAWENTAPRHKVRENVYVASTVPKTESIFFHSDHSQSAYYAEKVSFFCAQAPEEGGENPFVDNRIILAKMDPEVRKTFKEKGWRLVRNIHETLGVNFRDSFWDRSKEEVEEFCRAEDIILEWHGETVKTSWTRAAIVEHPLTGEESWYNHIAFWHIAALPDQVRENMLAQFGLEGMPFNVLYGDGTVIPDEVIHHIRELMVAHQESFSWQSGDYVIADNILTSHGRTPYKGDRKSRINLFNRTRRPAFKPVIS